MDQKNALLEFSVLPVGGGEHLSETVARCTRIVRDSNLKNELHAMGTLLEGDLDESLDVVKRCLNEVIKDAPRATASIRIDLRADGKTDIGQRVAAVEAKLQSNPG